MKMCNEHIMMTMERLKDVGLIDLMPTTEEEAVRRLHEKEFDPIVFAQYRIAHNYTGLVGVKAPSGKPFALLLSGECPVCAAISTCCAEPGCLMANWTILAAIDAAVWACEHDLISESDLDVGKLILMVTKSHEPVPAPGKMDLH